MFDPEWSDEKVKDYLAQLDCWDGSIEMEPLVGGLCNRSFVVTDQSSQSVARIGTDILVHGITQTSVQTSMIAAAEIGVSPAIRYIERGLAVVDFLTGGCLRPEDMGGNQRNCALIVKCLKRLHAGSSQISGPLTYFWPFQVVRQYIGVGYRHNSRLTDQFPELLRINNLLEKTIEAFQPVFTHNDTVPQNFMFDDNKDIWVIDWDYGGYGHPMFDLVGVSCNADMQVAHENELFEMYYGKLSEQLTKQLTAFKLVLNLREYTWGMVQEAVSDLDSANVAASMTELYPDQDPGYEGYTNLNRERFETNWVTYQGLFE